MTICFPIDCANEEALEKDPMPLIDLSETTVQTGTITKRSIKEMKEKTIKIDFFASPDDISVCKIHAVILQQWQANNLVKIKSNNGNLRHIRKMFMSTESRSQQENVHDHS